jgi:hypothetical protein
MPISSKRYQDMDVVRVVTAAAGPAEKTLSVLDAGLI